MIMRSVSRVALVAAGSTLGSMIVGGVLVAVFGNPWGETPAGANVLAMMFLGHVLNAAVLYYPVRKSNLRGGALYAAVFLACFGLSAFLTQIEAIAFLEMAPGTLAFTSLQTTLSALIVSALAVRLYGSEPLGPDATGATFPPGSWAWRIAVADVAYIVLYFSAGLLIVDHVNDYYDSQNFQAGIWMFPLQVFRGLAYLAFTLWLVRSLRGARWQVALSMAFLFPMFAGVAALLAPNGFMPDFVRHWHMVEIGWSNFVFGGLVGFLFWRRYGFAGNARETG